jgi:Ca2+-binding EF-hand superfamily protein
MQALATELARRRVRVKDYFQDFDRLRAGSVTVEQFRRVLATVDALKTLSPPQVDELIEQYATGAAFRYLPFIEDLEHMAGSLNFGGTIDRSTTLPHEGTQLYAAFQQCASQCRSGGIDVRQSFHPFDKHNNGKVSATQFPRSFPFRLDSPSQQAIQARYEADGSVDYFTFDAELRAFIARARDAAGAPSSTAAPTSPTAASHHAADVATSLQELKYHMHKEHVNVADVFRDSDPLRSGVITSGQFSSGLGRVHLRGFKLSHQALSNLVDAYTVAEAAGSRVSYSQFLRDLEESPMGGPHALRVEESERLRLDAILEKVRTAVRTRRINLKPTFQDFDRANKGIFRSLTCTRRRFERGLAVNSINVTPAEVDLLEKAYSVNRTGEADTDAINYLAFCRDVDAPDGVVESPSVQKVAPAVGKGTFNATTGATHVKKPLTLARVLDTAMLQIADRSIRLQEFIKDHDPLRSGTVSRDKLATAISISGLKLEPDEVQLLLDEYALHAGSDKVAYPRLLAALDCDAPGETSRTVHRVDEARARVTAEVQAATQAAHSAQLDAVLQRITDDVRARQILLPPFFQDYDKHHRGTITAAQFERVICRHRLPVSPADIQLLKQYFADPTDANNVRCRDFIAAVDVAEASRLPKYLRSPTSRDDASTLSPTRAAPRRPTLGEVLAKISATVLSRNIRVSEFFRDADPLRKGNCHENRFWSYLNSLGIGLTEAENEVLRDAYFDDKNTRSVNYSEFVHELEQVEFQKASGQPELTLSGGVTLRSAPPQGDVEAAQNIVAEDPFLEKVLSTIKATVNARRMSLRSTLQGFDPLRKGRIPASQFYSALSANGITFNALETSKLSGLLADKQGMNYNIFCRLVGE